ncbi:hypothetical protein H310_11817 [Aphanomyces invadans]|uniref:Uncharacterized protein n=1 Tax=Aphanomyces invadans TaxID=157072 RepID=A0A024TMF1_9STRA|nr:hypothetical protein H310_11817 [Aphanomyces invadans]ETV94507.1 hypothetical protein H310_11817 [Aphanomyces invadans]|eukprot:XP_008876822.1 hypothetical protein H310_11817 [Aphanomyces invadans]
MSSTATTLKEQGNAAFEDKRFDEAEAFYSKAILQEPKQHTLYGNRSAARFHQKKYQEALKDAETAVSLDPTWAKGHFRKGQAHEALHQLRLAQHAYESTLQHGGNKRDVVEKVAATKKAADKEDRERVIHSREDWNEIYTNISDKKLRLAILVKFWNASTKAERFSFFMRFLAILSDGGTPSRIGRYSTEQMEPFPASNYDTIELPDTWSTYYDSLALAQKGDIMQDMYTAASEAEKTTIINDMKYFIHQLYKEDPDDDE